MKFSISTAFALAGYAAAQASGLFRLEVESVDADGRELSGKYVHPIRNPEEQGTYWAAITDSPYGGLFHLTDASGDSALAYTTINGQQSFASTESYGQGSSSDLPIVRFQTSETHTSQIDTGFTIAEHGGGLYWRQNNVWWVCDETVSGRTVPVLTLWKVMPLIYPPIPEQRGCKRVKLISK